jgi:Mlc titration factor MtfA (ptsG expression regulator)
LPGRDFYTDYALNDLHEFWAESVEIYFEKATEMKAQFPSLYYAISNLLNQDHAARITM